MEKLPEIKRILAVFARPRKAMEDIGAYPTVLIPVMSMIIFPVLPYLLNIGYWRDQLVNQMAVQMQTLGVTMDMSFMVQTSLYGMILGAPVGTLLGWLVFALVVFLLSHMFGGEGELGFKKALSLTGYAYLVTVPFTILSAVLIMINPTSVINFSLFDLVSRFAPTENLYVISLLQMLSISKIWESAVVAVGIKLIKEISAAKAICIVVILFILQYAVQIASSAGLLAMLGM